MSFPAGANICVKNTISVGGCVLESISDINFSLRIIYIKREEMYDSEVNSTYMN